MKLVAANPKSGLGPHAEWKCSKPIVIFAFDTVVRNSNPTSNETRFEPVLPAGPVKRVMRCI